MSNLLSEEFVNSDISKRQLFTSDVAFGSYTNLGVSSTRKTTFAEQAAAAIVRNIPNAFTIRKRGFSIGDIKNTIMQIYMKKTSNPTNYQYDTGKLDEFGNPIIMYAPTVVIIDSMPNLSPQTDHMKVHSEIRRFYTEITPYQKEANIILIS